MSDKPEKITFHCYFEEEAKQHYDYLEEFQRLEKEAFYVEETVKLHDQHQSR